MPTLKTSFISSSRLKSDRRHKKAISEFHLHEYQMAGHFSPAFFIGERSHFAVEDITAKC